MSIFLKGHNNRVLVSQFNPHFSDLVFKKREKITGMSSFSRSRLGELLVSFKFFPFKTFLTLTFRNKPSAFFAKKEVKRFCQILNRRQIGWLWVMELQNKFDRGAIHFHFLLTAKYIPAKIIEAAWGNGFISIGSILSEKGIRKYLLKEISKENQKNTSENLGRWWSVSRFLSKKFPIGIYPDEIILDLVDQVGVKKLYWVDDFDKIGVDIISDNFVNYNYER